MRSGKQLAPGLFFARLGLGHCFALPPCVQRQNHTQAINRKRALCFSSHCELWPHTGTMVKVPESGLPPVTGNYPRGPCIPPSVPGPGRELSWGNRGILRKPFHLKISIPCIFSLYFLRTGKIPPHICSL